MRAAQQSRCHGVQMNSQNLFTILVSQSELKELKFATRGNEMSDLGLLQLTFECLC